MPNPIHRPATQDDLFLWVMHSLTDVFADKVILKGGMALRLLGSPRATNDVDFVFCPFDSKKDIHEGLAQALALLDGAEIQIKTHSKMIRASVRLDGTAIQVEATVTKECASIAMSTASLAQQLGQVPRVIRVVDSGVALANKLAAWNERRLLRDLYDCFLFTEQFEVQPDFDVLDARLRKVESRLPRLKKVKRISRADLAEQLRLAVDELSASTIQTELGPILPPAEIPGLELRLPAAVRRLARLLG